MSESSTYDRSVPLYEPPIVTPLDTARRIFTNPFANFKEYAISLFPLMTWIHRYNFVWAYSDIVAGVTTGIVMVPQSMSYAQIAGLPVQYGLYSSFVGAILYSLFATSKDVCIGPVAVMSAEVYKVTTKVLEKYPELGEGSRPAIASTLALVCGGITTGIGVLRLGFILEYISMPSVLGFMSGSAFTILVGQVPSLMGINKRFNTRDASYLVVVNTLRNLKHTTLDAAFGLVCLFLLFFFKYLFEFLIKRYPRHKKWFFYASNMRAAVIIIFSTLISWGVCRNSYDPVAKKYPISILKTVPRGLKDVGVHVVHEKVVKGLASELPIATIVLLLEHIAIAKSFGRINDYKINPNQELIAIGATNLVGHFFQAYPATGSFSRTALKAKCGVRTPLSGMFTGICVLVAIYGLTDAFFWISNASLAAVIIHAVVDLISTWRTSYKIWLVNPIEFLMFLGDILLCVFVSIEAGIYFSIAASIVWLLLRLTFPKGQILGKIAYEKVNNVNVIGAPTKVTESDSANSSTGDIDYELGQDDIDKSAAIARQTSAPQVVDHSPVPAEGKSVAWVPLSHRSVNPEIRITPPPPGIFVYKFNESLVFPNVSRQCDALVDYIRQHCRRDIDTTQVVKLGDRPWNDGGPRHRKIDPDFVDNRPYLRAVVLDLTATPHIDLTAVTTLWDIKQELTRFANRRVEFHFVGLLGAWQRRALTYGGFGTKDQEHPGNIQYALTARDTLDIDVESQAKGKSASDSSQVSVLPTDAVFFHLEIPDLQ